MKFFTKLLATLIFIVAANCNWAQRAINRIEDCFNTLTMHSFGTEGRLNNVCVVDSAYYSNYINGQDFKYYYFYDNNSHLIYEFSLKRMHQNAPWIDFMRQWYTYDANDNLILRYAETWSNTMEFWHEAFRETYTFDANNNMTESISEGYCGLGCGLENAEKLIFIYDENQNLTTRFLYGWIDGAWSLQARGVYSYDSNNNNTEMLYQFWNLETTSWTTVTKDVYYYDSYNNLIEIVWLDWNQTSLEWDNFWRYIYSYDANNNRIELLWLVPSSFDSEWDNYIKETYTYDSNNILLFERSQNWNYDDEVWEDDWHSILYNSCNSTLVSELDLTDFTLYPNPSNGQYKIVSEVKEGGTIEVFNFSGQKVFSQRFKSLRQLDIDISNQTNGIYVLKVNCKEDVWSMLLLKQ